MLRNGHKFIISAEQGKAVMDLLTGSSPHKENTLAYDLIRGVCFNLSDVVAIHPEADAR